MVSSEEKGMVNSPATPEAREGGEEEALQTLTSVVEYWFLTLLLTSDFANIL